MSFFLIILSSILLSAFFSGMEIAFFASNKLRLEIDKKHDTVSTRVISVFTKHPGQYIVTMLIGNNIALVIYGIVMALVLEPFLQVFFHSDTAILLLQTIISTLIILFTAEFFPKVIFRLYANIFLKIFSLPVFLFYLIFYPIGRFTIALSHLILRIFTGLKLDSGSDNMVFGKPDLDQLVNENSELSELLEEKDHDIKIFQNALDFSKVKLRECMVPRTELVALERDSRSDELRHAFIESGLSKILIYKETIDNIIGYVNLKDLFSKAEDIQSYIIPIAIVPESMPANKLLKLFVNEKRSIALVVDEFGGTSGIVTIEDILEEIFGEIEDEHDTSELIEKQINNSEYVFSARLEIDYLNEKYHLNLPEHDEYETLAGFIFFSHESIPKLNQRINISHFEFKILKVSETRIEVVHLKITEK
ncbi:MAG: HlyC/CorC family transporter [Bacteroidales bacterium]|nr:HlyC/CorC family transporter [Bacteroidales bacterium]